MQALFSLSSSAKEIASNRRAAFALFIVFVALLFSLALFVTTNLATIRAVLLTLLLMILAPALFFLLQTMCVSFAADVKAADWLKDCLQSFWKLLVVSVPVIVTAWLVQKLFVKIEAQQTSVLILTLKILLFGFALPLTLIHLWIETIRTDALSALKNFKNILAKAFAPVSVLIYFCGLFVFAFLPYLLLSPRISIQQNAVVISLLVLRMAIAALFVFFGWTITVNALSRNAQNA